MSYRRVMMMLLILTSNAVRYSDPAVLGEAKEIQVIGLGIHSFSDPASLNAAKELSAAPRLETTMTKDSISWVHTAK